MSDAITSTKLEPTGKIFWDSRRCVLSSAYENEMRGYLVYVLIVKKKLSHRVCLNSATAYKIGRSYREIWGDFFKHFYIYRDYVVKRRFFIYCSLATANRRRGRVGCTANGFPCRVQFKEPDPNS